MDLSTSNQVGRELVVSKKLLNSVSVGSPGSPVQQAKLRKKVETEQKKPLRRPLVKEEIKTEADPIDKIDKKYLHHVADNNKMKKGAR